MTKTNDDSNISEYCSPFLAEILAEKANFEKQLNELIATMNNEDGFSTNIMGAISNLQTQVATIQTNVTYIVDSIEGLKRENENRRNSIDTFANSTRERIKVIEHDISIGRWLLVTICGVFLTIGIGKVYVLLTTENHPAPQIQVK